MTGEASAGRSPVLQFLGATGTVTGSKFLIETRTSRVLVDCGLFQGLKELRRRNWEPLPLPAASIDAVVLTHAHLDHSGYLPLLARQGFRGRVYVTRGTDSLCRIVLPDSARLQEEEADYANRKGFSKHHPAEPLYTPEDAAGALNLLHPVPFDEPVQVAPDVRVTFQPAGHILGSATVTAEISGRSTRTVLFSGDLGRPSHPLLRPPAPPAAADVMLVESTYGNRTHHDEGSSARFADAISRTVARGGVVVIPAFAVDRTEVVLMALRRLMHDGALPHVPVYADSPMALAALGAYRSAIERGSPELRAGLDVTEDPFDPGTLVELRDRDASRSINRRAEPAIIISASGMASGGRVLHHLERCLPDRRNTVMLVGFQAAGTRGRALADGARQLKLLGRYVPVRAEVVDVPAFSAHADSDEILVWLHSGPQPPETLYVVHGEPDAADALAARAGRELGWISTVPAHLERVRLD